MWKTILEYFCAALVVGVFVVLPWLVFLSIGGQNKAISLISLNHGSWLLMTVRMTKYAVHDVLN